jgi:hypothetical protein
MLTWRIAMKSVLIVLGCLCYVEFLAAQETPPSRWAVEVQKAGTLQEIDAGYRKGTPKKGMTIVSVQGLVSYAASNQPTLRNEQVLLRAPGGIAGDLGAVGIVNKSGQCVYEMTTGFETATLGLHDKASGIGFSIEKRKKKDPVSITFDKLPAEVCFAFNLPEATQGPFTLQIDDATASVDLKR